MNNFWTLVFLEYKKLLCKKTVIVAIVACYLTTILLSGIITLIDKPIDSDENLTINEIYRKEQKIINELEGREIDTALILEASKNYDTNPIMYSKIYDIVSYVYYENNTYLTLESFKNFDEEMASKYYENRKQMMNENFSSSILWTDAERDFILTMDNSVETPFIYSNSYGYNKFLGFTSGIMIIGLFLINYIISPIFSDEYNKNMDNLILSSKNGKSSLIYAKIFSSITISALLTFIFLITTFIICMLLYGFNGYNAPIQLLFYYNPYNFTVLQVVLLIFITSLLGATLQTAFCMMISSFSKNSILPMTLSCMLLFTPGLISVAKIVPFLPVNMGRYHHLLQPFVYNIFGMSIMLYQMVFIVAILGILIFSTISFRVFKNHQV